MFTHETDVVVIGAGPVGLFAVFQSGMLGMKCHVIDALPNLGGQCVALYPEKPIYDIPAHPIIIAEKLIENLVKQAAPFAPRYHLNNTVMDVVSDVEDVSKLSVITDQNIAISCKAVIIAAGCGAFKIKQPPLDKIEMYEGKSVLYSVKKRMDFKGKHIVIAGGGDSAADWAVDLADVAERVSLVHRRKVFRCAPETSAKLLALSERNLIDVFTPFQLSALEGDGDGTLTGVIIKHLNGFDQKNIKADVLLPFFGIAAHLGPILTWNLELKNHHIIVDPSTCRTNRDGLYAVGDIVTYPNKVKLILAGFSEVTMACHDLYHRVFPNKPLNFEHSTSKGIPFEVENA